MKTFRLSRRGTASLWGRASAVACLAIGVTHMPAPPAQAAASDITSCQYHAHYLVGPNPLPATNGLAFDDQTQTLYVGQTFHNRVTKVDLATLSTTVIADDRDQGDQLQTPDDLALGPHGHLYVVNALTKSVVRMSTGGTRRTPVAVNITDGSSGPNGIAFDGAGRLFVTDLKFDPSHRGGLWRVDPAGVMPAVRVATGLVAPEGFGFASDGLAYVPEMYAKRIAVVDVDTGAVRRLPTEFSGLLTAAKVVPASIDAAEPIIVLESDVGRVWRVDRTSGAATVVAEGEPGLDNLVITADGTIYVSNFARGNVRRVDAATHRLVPILADNPLSAPTSLSLHNAGSLLVGDLASLAVVDDNGGVERVSRFLDSGQTVTPSAVGVDGMIYLSDWLAGGRLVRLDPVSMMRTVLPGTYVVPWHVRVGPAGTLLVTDQGLGSLFRVRTDTGERVALLTGLRSPGGLAYDVSTELAYVSDSDAGTVMSIPSSGGIPTALATGLDTPEGVAVDRDGSVLVVEAGSGRLLRIPAGGGAAAPIASGFATNLRGITALPFLNYTADVVVRPNGKIVVSGVADGSLVELVPAGKGTCRA